jgi:hypothetical protein
MFTKYILKRFHDDEKDDTFTRFTYLQQIGTINEYTHEWDDLATIFPDITDDQLLILYISWLKPIIHSELRLSTPTNLVEARSTEKND